MNKKNVLIFVMAIIILGFVGWYGYNWISQYYLVQGAETILVQIVQSLEVNGYIQIGNLTLVPYVG